MNLKQRKYKINQNKKSTASYTLKGMDIDAFLSINLPGHYFTCNVLNTGKVHGL